MYYLIVGFLYKIARMFRGKRGIEHVLVIQTAKIGDMVCSTPVYREIKKKYPGIRLTLLLHPGSLESVKDNANIDKIVTEKDIKEISDADTCFILTPSARSLFLANKLLIDRIFSIKPDFGNTTRRAVHFLSDGFIEKSRETTIPELYRRLLELTGIHSFSIKKEFNEKQCGFPAKNDTLKISISISTGNKFKEWGVKNFRKLTKEIMKNYPDTEIYILGIGEDFANGEEIASCSENVHNMCGKYSLQESAYIIKHSDIFIGMDSALSYIADCYDKDIICIFGPTDFREQRPMNPESVIIYGATVPCRPCSFVYKTRHECHHSSRFECLQKITVGRVFLEVAKKIEKKLT